MDDEDVTTVEPQTGRELALHYMKDLVYGANDGIVTTLAVIAGVTGAALDARAVLILGIANLLADGFSMGASDYLAIRSEQAVRWGEGKERSEPHPARHATATFLAFVLAGSLPLSAFVAAPPAVRFASSIGVALATLFIAGAARALVTPLGLWRAGIEMLLVGAAAGAVAYGVGAALASL